MKTYDNAVLNELIERFFRYTAIPSQSDEKADVLPSSPGQMELAQCLAEELKQMELVDKIILTDDAILTARIKGNPEKHAIGFVAHLDTVDIDLSDVIKPQIVHKEAGKDILLNKEKDIWLRESLIPAIAKYNGQDILVTDGTSVLGADNKAAISVMMTLASQLSSLPSFGCGDVYLAFVPDEEIGLLGAKALDPKRLPVTCAYTIDSNEVGELVCETFNAAVASFAIEGVPTHPMGGKNILVNPIMIVSDILQMLDRAAMPEHTEGREGYIWPTDLEANPTRALLALDIRDHDKEEFEKKKAALHHIHRWLEFTYPTAKIKLTVEDIYENIANSIPHPDEPVVALLAEAMKKCGIRPKYIAMRGGTDGSALSAKGIPTPNYFTGAHHFHSIYEFLPVDSFHLCYQVTEELVRAWAKIAKSSDEVVSLPGK